MNKTNDNRTLVSSVDYHRLKMLLQDAVADGTTPREKIQALRIRLQGSRVLGPAEMPDDVITMNSTARLRDLDTDEVEAYSLMYPAFANGFKNCVSVLASLGTAMLGHRAGDVIVWAAPSGCIRLKVEDVEFQPEKAGQYDV